MLLNANGNFILEGNECTATPRLQMSEKALCHLQIVDMLLANGAHIDLRNAHGQRPTSLLKNIPGCTINPLHFTKYAPSQRVSFLDLKRLE